MVEISVYSDIANKKEGIFMSMFGFDDMVFSADTVKDIFKQHKKEKDFKFNIHCDGGSVSEGLAIYDIMRTSGKNIYTNIEGSCHSMAMVLLLAAPFENRTSNRNSRSLIHKVYAAPMDYLNADDLEELADEVRQEENAILDIYEERTGADREDLENLMREEKQRTANELLEFGFISKINSYTTNKFKNAMSKNKGKKRVNQSLANKASRWLKNAANLLADTVNYDFEDEDGNVLFSTEAEDDSLEVGMTASPDGTYDLPDGRTVTIEEGVITDIQADSEDAEELENALEENTELRNQLAEAHDIINEYKNGTQSSYEVRNRSRTPNKRNKGASTSADRKKEANEKRNKWKGNK